MIDKDGKLSDPRIEIRPDYLWVVVTFNYHVVAESRDAQDLLEEGSPPVQYVPRKDVRMEMLELSEHEAYCAARGRCTFYDVVSGTERARNAAWSYEHPGPAAEAVRGHIAFDPDLVGIVLVNPDPG